MKVESISPKGVVPSIVSSNATKAIVVDQTQDSKSTLDTKQKGEFPFDEAVLEALPPKSTLVSVEHFGFSAYTTTGKLTARNPDGSESVYFVKIARGESGGHMLKGEFEASKAIHTTTPDFIPQPFSFGKQKSPSGPGEKEETYFYLSQFIQMDVVSAPDPTEFTRRLAHLHQTSRSPTGLFGFHVPTYDGNKPQAVMPQHASWPTFYAQLLAATCALDVQRNGSWPEYQLAIRQVLTKVIPRLLGTLSQIKPCLIHGDLWEGNMGVELATGRSVLFDASSYFAHNEMELGHWRCEFSCVFRDERYVRCYTGFYPPAEPVDEFEDRLRLYCVKGTVNYAAGRPGSVARRSAYNHMCYLVEKYAPIEGIAKYDPLLDPWVTGSSFVPHMD